jgi:hypothetical protein
MNGNDRVGELQGRADPNFRYLGAGNGGRRIKVSTQCVNSDVEITALISSLSHVAEAPDGIWENLRARVLMR